MIVETVTRGTADGRGEWDMHAAPNAHSQRPGTELAEKGQQQKWSPGVVGALLRTIVVRPVAELVGADRARASMESRGARSREL